ncbi:MAG: PpiC-type peptidyl-prolyl cis-trans isomerase [Flavipsychrobacter sp.]|nr:PpiC-type peptidyl-prolyl cis-trans isomerase [Flavipsychrobacter sp.]
MSFLKSINLLSFRKVSLLVVLLLSCCSVFAQESADKIIVVVGRNRIILKSDLEAEAIQARQQNPAFTDGDKCLILQQMILRKMLVEQAERDSVMIGDEDVDAQIENRLRYFISQFGSKEKLEQTTGKTIYQMKEEYREAIKEQMVAEKMQGTIMENIKTTPAEVNAFYKKIPQDSLPFFPATVEVGQIVIDPPVSIEMDDYAHAKLEEIRKEIISGTKTFEASAGIYSQDPGSRDNGGRYDGVTRNGGFATEFVTAAFKLQNGEISPIIKTKFGYHIIQMVQRRGEEIDIRHILIKPEVTSADFQKALKTLDSVHDLLVNGKMSFPEAVGKFSTDEAAKRTGGMIADPNTGNTLLDMTKLDGGMLLLLDSMKQGGYSAPHMFVTDQRERSCRIVYLRNRTLPHKANLQDDYSKIQELTMAEKKYKKMQRWVELKLPSFYLKIAPEYQECEALKTWRTNSISSN